MCFIEEPHIEGPRHSHFTLGRRQFVPHTIFPLLLSFSLRPMSDGSVFPLSLSLPHSLLCCYLFFEMAPSSFLPGEKQIPPHTNAFPTTRGIGFFSPPPILLAHPYRRLSFSCFSSCFLLIFIVQHPTVRGSRYNNYPRNAQYSLVRSP